MDISTELQNQIVSSFETVMANSSSFKIFTGSKPANTTIANTGTLLVSLALPNDWIADPVEGEVEKNDNWETSVMLASGTAGYFRFYDSSNVCHWQGSISDEAGSGDMKLSNILFEVDGIFVMNQFSISFGGFEVV